MHFTKIFNTNITYKMIHDQSNFSIDRYSKSKLKRPISEIEKHNRGQLHSNMLIVDFGFNTFLMQKITIPIVNVDILIRAASNFNKRRSKAQLMRQTKIKKSYNHKVLLQQQLALQAFYKIENYNPKLICVGCSFYVSVPQTHV